MATVTRAARARLSARSVGAWPVAAALPALVLAPVAVYRFLDGDEGDYAAAAALALDGKLLYHDFLYTQTPLLPYVYGAWAEIAGESWLAMRALSVAFAVATALLLFRHLAGRVGPALATVGVAVFSFSTLVFTWYPAFKTYALSTLLLFAAYVLVAEGRLDARRAAFAGALGALAVQTRSILLGGALVLAWAAWRAGARRLAAFGGGFVVALAPSLFFLAVDAHRFLFGNLWYHGARSEGGLVGDFAQKGEVVATLLGVATEARPIPQFLLLALASVAAAATLRAVTGAVPLSLVVAAGLAVVALLPTPTYTQYFATTIPFLVVAVVELVAVLRARATGAVRPFLLALGGAAAAAYLSFAAVDLYRATSPSKENRPAPVQEVADFIAARTGPGEQVVSSWAGYLFGTDAVPVPGLENAFAPHEAAALGDERAHRERLLTAADVEELIRRRETRLVVVKVWHDLPPIPDYDGAARAGGYRLAAELNTVRVYVAP